VAGSGSRNLVNTDIRRVASTRPLRVLVADADADTRSLYGQALHLAGCEVVEASDGFDALTKGLVRPPALIVIEMRLPLIDGRALCEIFRRDSVTRFVPILVVTVESGALPLQQIRLAGADAVLVKPTTADALVREVQRLMTGGADEPLPATVNAAVAACDRPVHPETPEDPERRTVLAKAHARFMTRTPPLLPPRLMCPLCDRSLTYDHSHIGGVNDRQSEQWDYYVCPSSCGQFQYRQRTRKLRCVS
jgi:CheY-like chemotaxis protein